MRGAEITRAAAQRPGAAGRAVRTVESERAALKVVVATRAKLHVVLHKQDGVTLVGHASRSYNGGVEARKRIPRVLVALHSSPAP